MKAEPAHIAPFELRVDRTKWEEGRRNKAPPRQQTIDKEAEIARFVEEAIRLDVIEECQATN